MQGNKKLLINFLILLTVSVAVLFVCSPAFSQLTGLRLNSSGPIPIKVLILPKFEVGEMEGDDPGEAQYYYERYLEGGETYELPGGDADDILYVKDGVALCVTGIGKASASISTMKALSDSRFDFSDAYVISTGCAGSARGTTVMGDVFINSAVVDYELGHMADGRDLADENAIAWYHDESYDDYACVTLDESLVNRVYELVKDVPLETTEKTRAFMDKGFDGAAWATRDPMVQRGTSVTADNYWKGEHNHEAALAVVETYGCKDPFSTTEMEDVAIGKALERTGMLDRFIIIRDSVNMDVFMNGQTPENLWGDEVNLLASDDGEESADIFYTAMENNFKVGSIVIDAILAGEL